MTYSSFTLGRIRNALEFADRATPLVEGNPLVGTEIAGFSIWDWCLMMRTELTAHLGRLDAAGVLMRQAIDLVRSHEISDVLAWTLAEPTLIARLSGSSGANPEADEARRLALEGVEVSERIGSHFSRCHGYRVLGEAHLLHGDWAGATEALETALSTARLHRTGLEREAHMLAELSEARLGAGDLASARALAEESVARAKEQGAKYFECWGRLALSRALLADPDADASAEIERHLERALKLVGETEGRALEPQIGEERARLAELRGDDSANQRELREAHRLYAEMGATGHAERVARELDS
jgi:hypothetical protein